MKNNLFGKATALVIGSLMIFSGQALAMKTNSQEISDANSLGESEILIAQFGGIFLRRKKPLKTNQAFARSISLAQTSLGNALAIANSEAISGSNDGAMASALAQSLAKASSLIGNATALSSSTAEGDQAAAAASLAEAVTLIGDALAIAESEAVSEDGGAAIAESLATAQTGVGNATAIAKSSARSN